MATVKPRMFGLSTCGWCAKARAWLDQNYSEYDLTYVDKLEGAKRDEVVNYLQSKGLRLSFPIIFFGDESVVGYQPDEYERLKGI
jgi:glutaredoxin-like protein NrdH